MTLPAGPLRENLAALKRIDIVIINGEKDENFEKKLLAVNKKIEIFYSLYKPLNLDEFKNKKLLAIAGIGKSRKFL